ncbi:DUF4123 domain-containing protein [Pyxidicoccus fallax]|uniref:DUF4123 domain-containing protein n=1 Tax=Pyxidicoccus fallax TaxID=394095 RepID=UPI0031B5A113
MSSADSRGGAGQGADDGDAPTKASTVHPVLEQQEFPLFALLDAARSERILQMLGSADEQRASLYTGPEGDALAEVAPYLVALPPGSELLGRLLEEGWGKAWGVFVTSELSFRELRRHFRRFLLVEDELGRSLYFRFYDPRVLRVFLDTCTPEHRAELFGTAVKRFFVESSDATLCVFDAQPSQVPSHAPNLQGPA